MPVKCHLLVLRMNTKALMISAVNRIETWASRPGRRAGGLTRLGKWGGRGRGTGLAGSRGVADPRPATRDPGRNQRPSTRDPERPGTPCPARTYPVRPGHTRVLAPRDPSDPATLPTLAGEAPANLDRDSQAANLSVSNTLLRLEHLERAIINTTSSTLFPRVAA